MLSLSWDYVWVVVQYPYRKIELLKNIFEDKWGIIFVDSEDVLKVALVHGNYDECFIDHFSSDFGHYPKKGNQLLVENVAGAIIEGTGLREHD